MAAILPAAAKAIKNKIKGCRVGGIVRFWLLADAKSLRIISPKEGSFRANKKEKIPKKVALIEM